MKRFWWQIPDSNNFSTNKLFPYRKSPSTWKGFFFALILIADLRHIQPAIHLNGLSMDEPRTI